MAAPPYALKKCPKEKTRKFTWATSMSRRAQEAFTQTAGVKTDAALRSSGSKIALRSRKVFILLRHV